MAVISEGIKLYKGDKALTNLQEIADLGGTTESIEITTLADSAHMYTNGIKNYGDSLDFKFLYEKEQFIDLNGAEGSQTWKVELPDSSTCSFSGSCSVKLDAVGVNAALTYTLSIKPDSAMVWA
jgi:hypothetical protein